MTRALQRILQKHHKKVDFSQRKSALLLTFANHEHKAIAAVLQKWLSAKGSPQTLVQHKIRPARPE